MLNLEGHINKLLTFDHSELDDLLAQLFDAFETENIEQVYRCLDLFWARLAMHIRAEHLHLFPAILQSVKIKKEENSNVPSIKTVKEAITNLQKDHNFFMGEIISAMKQMRDLRESDQKDKSKVLKEVSEKIIAVKERLEKHNELEETEVYGWADTLLQTAERLDLNEKMKKELSNLPPRFGKSNN